MTKKIANGTWVKYDREPGNWKGASYHKLQEDLKGADDSWQDVSWADQLSGEFIPREGTEAGDIYIYYEIKDGVKSPIFYLYVKEFEDIHTKEKKNYIEFNGSTLTYDWIDIKYIPELIFKLREIDEVKNKRYIEELEEGYERYQKLLSLKDKKTYTEEELLFIYYMAYTKDEELAVTMLTGRDIQKVFDNLKTENKIKLFLSVKDSKISDKITVTSKEILLAIAQNGCLKQLNNAPDEIINDKNFIIKVLECFNSSDKYKINRYELKYLPSRYQTDIDILEQCLYNYAINDSLISDWICERKDLASNKEFAYRLINAYIKSVIDEGYSYSETFLLTVFEDDVLNDIENHVLIGPETTLKREQLKRESIESLKLNKEKLLSYRRSYRCIVN